MRLWFHKSGRGLLPSDDTSGNLLARMTAGECLEFQVLRPRSVQWHRMYFGLCRVIGENQDPPRDEDSIDAELRVRAGHYDVVLVDEREVRVPKRIAFHALTGDEWAELWPKIDAAIRERFGNEYVSSIGGGSWGH